ncbi:hypothetical protein Goklo_016539 [Gossypium klotzschianum]|uniref:Ycf2 N-terminal domain-containing protein n=1 Tax=Gossypium klotzschianum TaxID=34286 RepID=A0A7J8UEH6_9ROSI|nr:hypothetical protein [Gossypium klotzschianum]
MILSMFPISSREASGLFLCKIVLNFMWLFCQDLFVSWGKNPHESDFLRNISRENWIWLDNVWLVNRDRFFSNVRNVSSNIQYDSTRSSFVQVMGSRQLKGYSPDPIVPIFGTSSAKVTEWVSQFNSKFYLKFIVELDF